MSGNYHHLTGNVTTPTVKFPIADKMNVASSQQGKPCGFFETQFFRCLEAYGPKLGRKFCDLENRDLKECVSHDKQRMRNSAIRAERWKQWVRGERKTPFEPDHLKIGEFRTMHFSNDLPI